VENLAGERDMSAYSKMFSKPHSVAALSGLLLLALMPAAAMAQQDGVIEPQPIVEEEVVDAEAIANDGSPPPDTHATSEAPVELVALAVREPATFIGKTLVLDDGADAVTVGPVLELRKRIQDQEPHLIVDATAYFNTPTKYAVAVRDLDRIEGDTLVTPEADGMHLRGLDYYPDDYTDLDSSALDEIAAADLTEGEALPDEAGATDLTDVDGVPDTGDSVDDPEGVDEVDGVDDVDDTPEAGVITIRRF
jgi:hypothetical protein